MTYIPHTDEDRRRMLEVIGVDSFEELIEEIPAEVRCDGDLPLPPPLSQQEVEQELVLVGKENLQGALQDAFLGGGVYDHYVPPMVGSAVSRPEFYSAYTPYQAEVSQGTLQATFEFQSMIARLTGMPLANASMYDGSTAFVEGVLMAAGEAKGRNEVIVPRCLNPRYRRVLGTHLGSGDLVIRELPYDESGRFDQEALENALSEKTAVVAAQNPNYFGHLEEIDRIAALAHDAGAFFLQIFEPVSLALVRTPGEAGADVAVGEGQTLGCALNYGGPLIGLFTCSERFLRRMPGRLAGLTEDADGTRAYTLALQTREQHIRRGRATSNICTNQQLLSLAALVHLASLGPVGFRQAALLSQERAMLLRKRLDGLGLETPFEAPYFREFVVRLPEGLKRELMKEYIVPGIPLRRAYPELGNSYLVATTEKRSVGAIERYAQVAKRFLAGAAVEGSHVG